MTAQLLEKPAATPARVRPVRTVRPTSARRSTRSTAPVVHAWSVGSARACQVARPATPAPAAVPRMAAPAPAVEGRLYWTPRGIAVLVSLVALVVGLMAVTMVGAFLSVSDAPVAPAPAMVAPVVAPGLH